MKLTETDYLTYQLYTASKLSHIKKSRLRGRLFTTIAFFILASFFFMNEKFSIAVNFLIFATLSAIFYPVYTAWYYKRHYLKHLREVYKNRMENDSQLEITDVYIFSKDNIAEIKVNTSEIEEVNEIKDYYLIKLKSGMSFIIPKREEGNSKTILDNLKSLITKNNIQHNVELDWQWK